MTKKILCVIVLMLVFICVFASCKNKHEHEFGNWETSKEVTCTEEGLKIRYCECGEYEQQIIPTEGHTFLPATCEVAQRCSACYVSVGEPLGHTTDSGICNNCGKNFSSWIHGYYVDKYQKPTDKTFIKNVCTGTSDGKKVYVTVWIDYTFEVWFTFSDYFEVSPYYPYDFCYDMTTIYVLDEDNQEHALSVQTYANQEDIGFTYTERDRKNQKKFKELMENNNILEIVIQGWDYTYSFTLNTKGIAEGLDYLSN